jgi:hypothetical protein
MMDERTDGRVGPSIAVTTLTMLYAVVAGSFLAGEVEVTF